MCNQYNGASPKEARLVTLQDLRESLDLEASCASEPEYDGGGKYDPGKACNTESLDSGTRSAAEVGVSAAQNAG